MADNKTNGLYVNESNELHWFNITQLTITALKGMFTLRTSRGDIVLVKGMIIGGTLCATSYLIDDIRSFLLRSSQISKLTPLRCLGESVDLILGRVGLDLSMMLFFVLSFQQLIMFISLRKHARWFSVPKI
ncbi:hypothetical protein T11_8133 [Trichinella zimbabwensis]|uniref:Uncharacterized protein n=1 Tax=Trichinella zimbabwensis TaxID=268475 RepID=A0A0V1HDG3_9BILA|nr:hypothetical protein T11_8133 [Trichinella zimbabwensis]